MTVRNLTCAAINCKLLLHLVEQISFHHSFVDILATLKLTSKSVKKVTGQANTVIFHPMSDKALALMGDSWGNLGLWNASEPDHSPILTQPHSDCITEVNVHRESPNWLVTASEDGSVRITDVAAMKVLEPFRSDDVEVLCFDFITPHVAIKGQSNSKASVLDLREPP